MINSKYKAYIYAAYVSALVTLVGLGYTSYHASVEAEQNIKEVLYTHQVLADMEQLHSLVKDAQRAQRGYLLTQDTVYLAQFLEADQQVQGTMVTLFAFTKAQTHQQQRMAILNHAVDEIFQYWHTTLTLSLNQQHNAALHLVKEGKGYQMASGIEKQILDFQLYEKAMLQKLLYEYQNSRKVKRQLELGGGVFSVLMLGFTFLVLRKLLNHELCLSASLASIKTLVQYFR